MSNKHFIKKIHLYHELSPEEKHEVDEHVRHCESCRQYLLDFMSTRKMIKRLGGTKPEPDNAAGLTSRIMTAVQSESSKPRFRLSLLDQPAIRYGMAICSFVLAVVFITQTWVAPPSGAQHESIVESGREAFVLSTTSLLRDVRDQYMNGREPKSWYACIKEGACDERTIKKIKSSNLRYAKH